MDKLIDMARPVQQAFHCSRAVHQSRALLWPRRTTISQCGVGAGPRFVAGLASVSTNRNFSSSTSDSDTVDAVVVGGGPGGIAVVGNLLDQLPGKHRQLWADPSFQSGRVGARYREVPSNTKVDLFLQFATCLAPFQHVVDSTPEPNAATALRKLQQDKGCELGHAADLCLMLTDGLARHFSDRLQLHRGRVTAAVLDKQSNVWTVALDSGNTVRTPRVVLCTGSSPISAPLPILSQMPDLTNLDLDVALAPSVLAQKLDAATPATVAVVGASHSAILVLMNLYNLAATSHPHLRVKWFTRHKSLRYAEYKDGWILYDNTGLKGQAAQWARENLEEETSATSPVSKVIAKLWTSPDEAKEDAVYHAELPSCTHVVQAVGYQRDPLPQLYAMEHPGATPDILTIEHDSLTGRIFGKTSSSSPDQGRRYLPGLFGAGIAFPERVTDPAGNVEYSVGFWKFMKFCRKVVPQWVAKS